MGSHSRIILLHNRLSSPRMRGSSTPRLIGSIAGVSGILDHPHARVMTTESVMRHSNPKNLTASLRANGSRECAPDGLAMTLKHGSHYETQVRDLAARTARDLPLISAPSKTKGARECRVHGAP